MRKAKSERLKAISKTKSGYTLIIRAYDRRGYTLIEILVSLTIISFIFGVGFVAFREFSRRQVALSTKRILEADLRLAQSEALAGSKPDVPVCTSQSTYVLTSYAVRIIPPSQYRVEAWCTGGIHIVKTVDLPGATLQMAFGSSNPITFRVLGDGLGTSGATNGILIYTPGGVEEVTITRGGSIE